MCLVNFSILALSIIHLTMGVEVTVLVGTESQNFTEALFWDYDNGVLLFVDRDLFEIHRFNTITRKDQVITLDQMPGFVIPTKHFDRHFIIGEGTSVVYLFWPYDYADGSYYAKCLIGSVEVNSPKNNFNDGKADKCGRVWCATYRPTSEPKIPNPQAALYRIDLRKPGKADITAALKPIPFGNDLTWTKDFHIFYFTDTVSGCVYSFNYDLVNGLICFKMGHMGNSLINDFGMYVSFTNLGSVLVQSGLPNPRWLTLASSKYGTASLRRCAEITPETNYPSNNSCGQTVFCFSDYNITGRPDGMTTDCNDDLWIASYGGGLVLNVSPNTKQLIRTVTIPVLSVTDVEFGGPDLDILFVATRNVSNPTDLHAGSIFQVTGLNVFGLRGNLAVMNSDCTPATVC